MSDDGDDMGVLLRRIAGGCFLASVALICGLLALGACARNVGVESPPEVGRITR